MTDQGSDYRACQAVYDHYANRGEEVPTYILDRMTDDSGPKHGFGAFIRGIEDRGKANSSTAQPTEDVVIGPRGLPRLEEAVRRYLNKDK